MGATRDGATFVRADLVLVATGVLAMIAAPPPYRAWFVGLVAWVPLASIIARGQVRRAAAVGWLQGAVAQGLTLWSIPAALREYAGTPPSWSYAIAAVLAVYEGARVGVVALLASRAVRNRWPLTAAFPFALVCTEWLYPMVFPWSSALFLDGAPVLLQGAELGGPLTISLWMGFLNASLVSAWVDRRTPSTSCRNHLLRAGGCLGAVLLFGAARMRAVDEQMAASTPARVGLVQGNLASPTRESRDPVALYREASLELTHREKLDLLIWPETAIGYPTKLSRLGVTLRGILMGVPTSSPVQRLDVPLLVGMVVVRDAPQSPGRIQEVNADGTWKPPPAERFFNSGVLAAHDGDVLGIYDKRSLLAFGEYIPGESRFPWLRRLLPHAGNFSVGSSVAPLSLGGRRIAVVICYEDILPERVRSAVRSDDTDLLVNITSDVWFSGSRVPSLHQALARLRSIEHRRFLVHATNTGVTAVVDAAGRVITELPPNRTASAVATVRWMRETTVYEAIGNLPWWGALGLLALGLGWRRSTHLPNTAEAGSKLLYAIRDPR